MDALETGVKQLEYLVNSHKRLHSFLHLSKEDCIKKIRTHSPVCIRTNLVEIRKKKQLFEIQKRSTLSNIHPLSKMYFSNQSSFLSIEENISFVEKYLPNWNIDVSKIEYFKIDKENNKYSLTISHVAEWEDVELNHLRYYFFIIEITESFESVLNSIKLSNFFNVNQEQLMEIYQRIKFEINLSIYEILKDFDIDIKDCVFKLKDEYIKIDYIITVIVFLEKLIESIDKRYENCIEKSFNVSSIYMRSSLLDLQNRIDNIENILHFSVIPKKLKEIVLNTLKEFKSNTLKDDILFKKYNYVNVFTNYLDKLLSSYSHINQLTENRFIEFLIEMNFNDYNFLNWLAIDLNEKVNQITDAESKTIFLMSLHTKFLNFPVRINSMYVDCKVDLKTQIINLITKELNSSSFNFIEKEKASQNIPAKSKIKLNKNASIVILLFKLLNESDLMNKISMTELAQFISKNFSTKNTENLSVESIRNKLYEQDPKTNQQLIIELKNVISLLQKESF
jgi:hypothetical protein